MGVDEASEGKRLGRGGVGLGLGIGDGEVGVDVSVVAGSLCPVCSGLTSQLPLSGNGGLLDAEAQRAPGARTPRAASEHLVQQGMTATLRRHNSPLPLLVGCLAVLLLCPAFPK